MGKKVKTEKKKPPVAKVRAAIESLAAFGLRRVARRVAGREAHIVLPAIEQVMPAVILIADAAEAGMLRVKR